MENTQLFDSEFVDGHKSRAADDPTRLVHNLRNQVATFVSIFDDLLNNDWCARTYEYSLLKKKPWGVYIPSSDILDPLLVANNLWDAEPERAIALIATRELFFKRGNHILGEDLPRIAGTAVWCLSSDVGDSVQYHIDYAELFRYETNIICPPLYAGTYHVTPFRDGDMVGGDFMANIGGLTHYKKFGYKGRLMSSSCLSKDIEESEDWIKVKYQFNRGIVHHGDMPHMSSIIESIKPSIGQSLPLPLPPPLPLRLSSPLTCQVNTLAAPTATGGASSARTTVTDVSNAKNADCEHDSRLDSSSDSCLIPTESSVIKHLDTVERGDNNKNENVTNNENINLKDILRDNLGRSSDGNEGDGHRIKENEGSRKEVNDDGKRMKRVILGFNCFPNDQGSELEECCRRAPEHSDAFNRTIKLYQTMTALRGKGVAMKGDVSKETKTATTANFCDSNSSSCSEGHKLNEREKITEPLLTSLPSLNDSNVSPSVSKGEIKVPVSNGSLSAAEILKNPALSRLLVMAARKVKMQRER